MTPTYNKVTGHPIQVWSTNILSLTLFLFSFNQGISYLSIYLVSSYNTSCSKSIKKPKNSIRGRTLDSPLQDSSAYSHSTLSILLLQVYPFVFSFLLSILQSVIFYKYLDTIQTIGILACDLFHCTISLSPIPTLCSSTNKELDFPPPHVSFSSKALSTQVVFNNKELNTCFLQKQGIDSFMLSFQKI